jgi:YVTN family beta-propeller protein
MAHSALRRCLAALATLSFPLFAAVSLGQATPSASLLVLSKQDHTMAIVDPATLKVLAKLPVGDDPHEIIASSDGNTAYVSNYGFGRFHTLTVLDLAGQKQKQVIDLGALRGPHGLHFMDGKVWFTAEAAKVIGSYDPATDKVDWVMGTGQNRTHMIYVFPGAKKILTTNVSSASVTILEHTDGQAGMPPGPPPGAPPSGGPGRPMPGPPGGDWNETVIPVGRGSEGFDVLPDGKQAWVANAGDGTLSIIDIDAKRVTATLAANARGANRVKFTPDGKRALISAGPELVIFDVASQKEMKRLPIGHGSGGVLVQPDGARAFVACSADNYVVVVDMKTLEITARIEAGGNPDGLAWAARK